VPQELVELPLHRVVLGLEAELEEDGGVLDPLGLGVELLDQALELRPLALVLLGRLLVVPEAGLGAQGLELGDACGLARDVKDNLVGSRGVG